MPNSSEIIAIGLIIPIVDGVVILLRFYSRRGRVQYGFDDLFIIVSWIISLGCGAILIRGATAYGFGQNSPVHTSAAGYTLQNQLTDDTKRLTVMVNTLSPWALGTAKLSFLFFYRRIFRGRVFTIVLWITIFIVIGWIITFFFLILFQCGPHVPWLWTSAENIVTHCLEGEPIALSCSSFDFAADIAIFAIPMYWTSTVHMSRAKKLLVYCIFLFGSLAALASLVRLIVYLKIYPGHNSNPNQLGYFTGIAYFSMLEIGLAIIAACLPTLGTVLSENTKQRLNEYLSKVISTTQRFGTQLSSRGNFQSHSNPSDTASISLAHIVRQSSKGSQMAETYAVGSDNHRVSDEEAGAQYTMES